MQWSRKETRNGASSEDDRPLASADVGVQALACFKQPEAPTPTSRLASTFLSSLLLLALPSPALAEKPNDIDRRDIDRGLAELRRGLDDLPETAKAKVDAEICFKALSWMLRHDEWVRKTAVRDALNIVKIGKERIRRIQEGQPAVPLKPGKHVLAYQSAVNAWFFPRLGDAAVLKLNSDAATPVWSTIMNSNREIKE